MLPADWLNADVTSWNVVHLHLRTDWPHQLYYNGAGSHLAVQGATSTAAASFLTRYIYEKCVVSSFSLLDDQSCTKDYSSALPVLFLVSLDAPCKEENKSRGRSLIIGQKLGDGGGPILWSADCYWISIDDLSKKETEKGVVDCISKARQINEARLRIAERLEMAFIVTASV